MPNLSKRWAATHFGKNWADLRVRTVFLFGFRRGLTARDFLAIELHEINVFKIERRKAPIAGDVVHDAANEREHHPRAFDQKEGVKLILGDTFHLENADILHFQ